MKAMHFDFCRRSLRTLYIHVLLILRVVTVQKSPTFTLDFDLEHSSVAHCWPTAFFPLSVFTRALTKDRFVVRLLFNQSQRRRKIVRYFRQLQPYLMIGRWNLKILRFVTIHLHHFDSVESHVYSLFVNKAQFLN